MLTIFGPIQWAFSLLPKWEGAWAKWLTRYLTVHFYGAMLYFVGFYVLLLFDIVLCIQVENLTAITASEQTMAAYLQNSFFSAGYLMAASIVALKCLNLVPDLAAWMIPEGDTAFSTRNFGEGVAQQAKMTATGAMGAALLIFGWRQPLWWRSPPDWLPAQPTGRRGVVLVHGLMCNRGVWLHWLGHLRAAGHAHVAVNLEPVLGSIDGYAKAIDEAVRRVTEATGLPPVLVCHSMGGLAARAWLRAYAADARVHRVLTLGTPHAGTWLARFSHTENGRQMRMNSAWLQALKAQEPPSRAKLFVCWYSNCDNIVFPATVAALPGAQHRLVTGVAHVQMVLDPQVVQACLRELEAPVPELPALTR
jgi:pimeloyl-ACP methyl ester carboxylesterase